MKEYLDFSHQKWYTPAQFAEIIDNSINFILRITANPNDTTASELADVLSWLLHIKELALNSTSHDE